MYFVPDVAHGRWSTTTRYAHLTSTSVFPDSSHVTISHDPSDHASAVIRRRIDGSLTASGHLESSSNLYWSYSIARSPTDCSKGLPRTVLFISKMTPTEHPGQKDSHGT
jgi:hypothetical protein